MPLFGEAGPLTVDDVLAFDLDADGLTGADETRLETSPWSADSDGDGALDGTEGLLFGTDPSDPSSTPPATPVADFAPSTLINDWVTLAHPEGGPIFGYYMTSDWKQNASGVGVLCFSGTCYHPDGVPLTPTLPDIDELSLMLSGEGWVEPMSGGLRAVAFGPGGEDRLTLDRPDVAQTYAVDAHEVYFRTNTINGLEILRYLDGESLLVVDADRWGCPIVANQAELDACPPPPAQRTQVAWAGYDIARRALIVLAGNDSEWWLSAVTRDGRATILTPGDLDFANVLEAELVPLTNGQRVLRLTPRVLDPNGAPPYLLSLDERLRPQATRWELGQDFRTGPVFGEGVFSPLGLAYPIYDDGGHGGPLCFNGVCVEERAGGHNIVQYIYVNLATLWVPRAAQPLDGEAILAVRPFGKRPPAACGGSARAARSARGSARTRSPSSRRAPSPSSRRAPSPPSARVPTGSACAS